MAALILLRYRQRRLLRRNQIFRDRTNPLHKFNDLELFWQFRFRQADILQMTNELKEELEHLNRKGALPPVFTGRRTALNPCQQWTSIARQTVCPGRLQFPIYLFFIIFCLFVCFFLLLFFIFFYFLFIFLFVFSFLFFSPFFFSSLSLWRSLFSCHSAFHELSLVFERTHRSCFLFLRYPATTGPFVGWSPCCLRCSEWSLYSQPLLQEAQWSLREYNWVSWPVLSSHLHSARPLFVVVVVPCGQKRLNYLTL